MTAVILPIENAGQAPVTLHAAINQMSEYGFGGAADWFATLYSAPHDNGVIRQGYVARISEPTTPLSVCLPAERGLEVVLWYSMHHRSNSGMVLSTHALETVLDKTRAAFNKSAAADVATVRVAACIEYAGRNLRTLALVVHPTRCVDEAVAEGITIADACRTLMGEVRIACRSAADEFCKTLEQDSVFSGLYSIGKIGGSYVMAGVVEVANRYFVCNGILVTPTATGDVVVVDETTERAGYGSVVPLAIPEKAGPSGAAVRAFTIMSPVAAMESNWTAWSSDGPPVMPLATRDDLSTRLAHARSGRLSDVLRVEACSEAGYVLARGALWALLDGDDEEIEMDAPNKWYVSVGWDVQTRQMYGVLEVTLGNARRCMQAYVAHETNAETSDSDDAL